MIRVIVKIEFDYKNRKIIITDSIDTWEFDGNIIDYCPRILDRWNGYIDRVKKEYNEKNLITPNP